MKFQFHYIFVESNKFLTINSLYIYIYIDSGYEYFNRCGAGLQIVYKEHKGRQRRDEL